jgi:hypothetical protein
MRFVPSRNRRAYFPRTPPEKSYSCRSSSDEVRRLRLVRAGLDRLRLFFFIIQSLAPCGEPGGDQPNIIAALGVGNHDEAMAVGESNEEKAGFTGGVVGIGDGHREEIRKGGGGFFEGDTMLAAIGLGLIRIPLEAERHGLCVSPLAKQFTSAFLELADEIDPFHP